MLNLPQKYLTLQSKYLHQKSKKVYKTYMLEAGCWWLTPIILATQEAEIRRIEVQSQPGQIVLETLSQKNPSQK
jgi:hypothetical protein